MRDNPAAGRKTPPPVDEDDFEALLALHMPKAAPKTEGELLDATIIGIVDDEVLVTYGSKEEVPIALGEFLDANGQLTVKVGTPFACFWADGPRTARRN